MRKWECPFCSTRPSLTACLACSDASVSFSLRVSWGSKDDVQKFVPRVRSGPFWEHTEWTAQPPSASCSGVWKRGAILVWQPWPWLLQWLWLEPHSGQVRRIWPVSHAIITSHWWGLVGSAEVSSKLLTARWAWRREMTHPRAHSKQARTLAL